MARQAGLASQAPRCPALRKIKRSTRQTIFRPLGKVCDAVGVEDRSLWHPHVLKHSCPMLLVAASTNAFLIRQQLGHKSFGSALRYVNPKDRQSSEAAVRAFPQLFWDTSATLGVAGGWARPPAVVRTAKMSLLVHDWFILHLAWGPKWNPRAIHLVVFLGVVAGCRPGRRTGDY